MREIVIVGYAPSSSRSFGVDRGLWRLARLGHPELLLLTGLQGALYGVGESPLRYGSCRMISARVCSESSTPISVSRRKGCTMNSDEPRDPTADRRLRGTR